jgi:hypothetical protein
MQAHENSQDAGLSDPLSESVQTVRDATFIELPMTNNSNSRAHFSLTVLLTVNFKKY